MNKHALFPFVNMVAPLAIMSSFLIVTPVWSQDVINIAPAIATGEQGSLPRLQLWEGSGLNISFSSTGETLSKVWLDDPSRITLDFDAPIDSGQAKAIHLRRINQLDFENLPKTSSTLLTVVTNKNRYQFILTYGTGNPEYYGVNIAQPSATLASSSLNLEWEQRIKRGLQKAKKQGLITREQGNMVLAERVNRVLTLVTTGKSLDEAASVAGVSLPFLQRLEEMGGEGRETEEESIPSELEPIDYFRFLENSTDNNSNSEK